MKVLIVSAHMDDEVLGAGGAIAKHVESGDRVYVCAMADRAYGHRYDEKMVKRQKKACLAAKNILGYKDVFFLGLKDEQLDDKEINIIKPLEEVFREVNPEIVYINHQGDSNQDHRAAFNACMIVSRTFANPRLKKILSFEVLSSTEQAPPVKEYAFLPNCYINIEKYLDQKVKAMECYKDELKHFPHPRSAKGIITLAEKRGLESGFKAAEAFMVIRERLE